MEMVVFRVFFILENIQVWEKGRGLQFFTPVYYCSSLKLQFCVKKIQRIGVPRSCDLESSVWLGQKPTYWGSNHTGTEQWEFDKSFKR